MAELPKDIKRNDYPALSRYWAKRYREAASRLEEFNEANISQKHRIRELEVERDAERKARKAAEAVNAEAVLAKRTNLNARIESLEVERDEYMGLARRRRDAFVEAATERDELRAIVRDLSEHEDQPCQFDHHGYCQEHGWLETDPPCPIPRARAALGLLPSQEEQE